MAGKGQKIIKDKEMEKLFKLLKSKLPDFVDYLQRLNNGELKIKVGDEGMFEGIGNFYVHFENSSFNGKGVLVVSKGKRSPWLFFIKPKYHVSAVCFSEEKISRIEKYYSVMFSHSEFTSLYKELSCLIRK